MHDIRREALEMAIAYAGKASGVDVMAVAEQFHVFLMADAAAPAPAAIPVGPSLAPDVAAVSPSPVAPAADAVVPTLVPVPTAEPTADLLTSPVPMEPPPAPPVAPVAEPPAPAVDPEPTQTGTGLPA